MFWIEIKKGMKRLLKNNRKRSKRKRWTENLLSQEILRQGTREN